MLWHGRSFYFLKNLVGYLYSWANVIQFLLLVLIFLPPNHEMLEIIVFHITTWWQLDLRCGAKKSLADPPKQCLNLKSCDISSTRPHLLLVGGRYFWLILLAQFPSSPPFMFQLMWIVVWCFSDAFARLYDRRMLPPLTSCGKMMTPPPCVNYFCPMHLSDHVSFVTLHFLIATIIS